MQKETTIQSGTDSILTKENTIPLMRKYLKGKKPDYDTLMAISFYMDFAIHIKDLELIKAVHDLTNTYIVEYFNPVLTFSNKI